MSMNKFISMVASATILFLACGCGNRVSYFPRAIDPALTEEFDQVFFDVRRFVTNEVHVLLVVKDGKVVYEQYRPDHQPESRHIMWSATKTFTATAVGFAVQDGLLSVDDKVVQFFTDEELPAERSPWLEQMTVKDLLIMSSGFEPYHDGIADFGGNYDWAYTQLHQPMYFEPGTRFRYDSMDSYLVSVILSRVTGKRMDDYLNEKLFRALGIKEYYWEHSPQNYTTGGGGLFIRPESLAKMGQFLLQEGKWEGRQLLDPEWIAEATSPQIMQYAGTDPTPEQLEKYASNDKMMGYGYQVWCCPGGFRMDGAHGQYCYILPEKRLVIVCFASTRNPALLRKSITEHIINYPGWK